MYQIGTSNISNISLLSKQNFTTYKSLIPLIKSGGSWWLSDAGEFTRYALVVSPNNEDVHSTVVNSNMKVRPALTLISSIIGGDVNVGSIVTFGNLNWVVLNGTFVICEDCIGNCAFRSDWKALNANSYTYSTVLSYMHDWLNYWKPGSY